MVSHRLIVSHRSWSTLGITVVALVLLLLPFASTAWGQCPPRWATTIGVPGTNGAVYALAVLPGGDVIVGGSFSSAGGIAARNIARYSPATGTWSALGSGTDRAVYALALMPGGDVIVGGLFLSADGVAASRIARYDPVTDTWFAMGSGVSSTVYALAVVPGGDVIVGGSFSTANGAATNYIVRYSPTTSNWSSLGSGTNRTVSALAVLPNGDVVVGGEFTTAGGVAVNNIARFTPATGAWSALGSGTDFWVHALAALPGGDVVVGGSFNTAGGVAGTSRIARYSPTSNVWSALESGISGTVHSLAVTFGDDIVAGGNFTTASGRTANHLARYSPLSNTWSSLGTGTNGIVFALAFPYLGTNSDIIAGGTFSTAEGAQANNITRWLGDTDGDGLPDDWECNGIPYTKADGTQGQYILDSTGDGMSDANWLRKDLFVEVDAMAGRAPSAATLQRVVDAFDPGRELVPPVPNVAGALPNIRLHIVTDASDLSLSLTNNGDYVNGTNGFGDFATDKARYFGSPAERGSADWGTAANPGPRQLAKRSAFRYCIFANSFLSQSGRTTSSGVAKGIPSNDFMVTLGAVGGGTPDQQAGTFMHELGHTLGLRHGGGPGNQATAVVNGVMLDGQNGRGTLADVHWRPNYYSVMSYWWQVPDPTWQGGAWGLRYSEAALPTLDESALNESAGIGASLPNVGMPFRVGASPTCPNVTYYPSSATPQLRFRLASFAAGSSVDWNNDCVPTPTSFSADVNDFSGTLPASATMRDRVLYGLGQTPLDGHHDWANLIYDFKTSPTYAPGAPAEPVSCNYDDAVRLFLSSIRRACPPDFNLDAALTAADIFDFLIAWFSNDPRADFNGVDGITVQDIFAFLAAWFAGCP